jgi:hypothetical protein
MSRAAYDLQVLATAHSASCGHPRFVPDDYLEYLDGLAIETTIAAAELCTADMWERLDGGYRVLDWEAVEICLDQVRQRTVEDQQALAWEREHEALVHAQMAQPILVTLPCAACGTRSARIELLAPGQFPAEWEQWPRTVQGNILRRREPAQWYLLVKGIATDNGYGDPIDASRAGADCLGVPASPALLPGPHCRVPRRCRILPGLRSPLLLPALAPVRHL